MEEIITVIIPIYNASKFLSQCLDSVLSQTYKHLQIILINDGSTDDSLAICKLYGEKDKRILIVSKENEGVSVARNIGIKYAEGTYIYFMDADDLLKSDALYTLVTVMRENNASLVRADYQAINCNGEFLFSDKKVILRRKYCNKILSFEEFYLKVLLHEYFLFTCLFRAEIINNNNITFIPHCRLMEDSAFVLQYGSFSEKNIYFGKIIYEYRKHDFSATCVKKDYSVDLKLVYDTINNNIAHSKYKTNFLANISKGIDRQNGNISLCHKLTHVIGKLWLNIRYILSI